MFAPWLIMCVYAPLAMLVLAAVLLAASDHAAVHHRHALGLGVPTRTIYQRLDWERKLAVEADKHSRRCLAQWREDRAALDTALGIRLPAVAR